MAKVQLGSIALLLLFLTSFEVKAEVIKKTKSGICHDKYSSYYDRTKNFKAFSSLKSCIDSGGRLPKNYKGNELKKVNSKSSNNQGVSSKYSRSQFGSGWADFNRDCQNSRMEALISQSLISVRYKTSKQCQVISGKWISPFTGKIIYSASEIDIDHVVPLSWAWRRGANKWSKDERVQFANAPANLLSVEVRLNRQKSDKGPDEWLPPTNQCEYISRFIRIYKTYKLQLTDVEIAKYTKIKKQYCK